MSNVLVRDIADDAGRGAHGRTGTALACLAIIDGHDPDSAVACVRTSYCEHAIETPEQEAFVRAFRTS